MSDSTKCDGTLKTRSFTISEQFDNSDIWPEVERGDVVVALTDLDPVGADVKAGEQGVVFEEANFYKDGCGPMVRWFTGGCCNVYVGDIENKTLEKRRARALAAKAKYTE